MGSLNVYVRTGGEDRKIWGLTGDAGNNWYMGQAPIASTDNFRVSMRSGVELETNLRCLLLVMFHNHNHNSRGLRDCENFADLRVQL